MVCKIFESSGLCRLWWWLLYFSVGWIFIEGSVVSVVKLKVWVWLNVSFCLVIIWFSVGLSGL